MKLTKTSKIFNNPDLVSNGKQAAVHGERANVTGLVLGCVEANLFATKY